MPPSLNQRLIESYTSQPSRLPEHIRNHLPEIWGEQELILYAMADLDPQLRLQEQWVLLGNRDLCFVRKDSSRESLCRISRSDISTIHETADISGYRWRVIGKDPSLPPLIEIHFSRRQQRCLENIRLMLEAELPTETDPELADRAYSDSLSEPIRDAQAAIRGDQKAVIWRLLSYLKPYKKDLWIGGLAAVFLTALSLVPPRVSGLLIDGIEARTPSSELWKYLGYLAGAYLLHTLFVWVRLSRMAYMGERVAHDIRTQVYAHLQTLSLRFFTRKQTGSIISRCSSDTDRLWDFIAFGVIEVALSILMLLGLGTVLMMLDWRLGLLLTLPVPFILFSFVLHGRKMQHIFLKAFRKWSDLTSVLSGTIPGIRVVKAFHQEERETQRFLHCNDECLHTFTQVHKVWTRFWPSLTFCFHVITLSVYFFALPRLTGDTSPAISIGTFVTFLLYAGMFMQPLQTIGQMTRMMNRAVSSAHRIFEILDTEPHIPENVDQIKIPRLEGRIQLENVRFSYDGVRQVIKDISLELQPGEMVGLVGPSGAGKSTLIQLMVRFYDPSAGRILIDGHDLRELDMGSYRTQVGMVLQEPYLFHGSIRENIAYGMEDAEPASIVEAARAAHAHEFICKLPQAYETVIGERGQTLSGGERQRISIARAILHNPRILILDEATSNVDTETERKIQDALDRLISGRTVIAIAHRLSTLRRADRLLVLKDGKLVESGTHEELLKIDQGVFKGLYDMQQELHQTFVI
ncbi:ABC transporter ATP-binding protein [Kiritimatiellaeota bacterium B1221]|nr:ABC transporter ATP-binding protein [Kiritimatiellaeota bacterium B1221]